MDIQHSCNENYSFVYGFHRIEKELIASVLSVAIKRLNKKLDRLKYKYEGEVGIGMKIDEVRYLIKFAEELIKEFQTKR